MNITDALTALLRDTQHLDRLRADERTRWERAVKFAQAGAANVERARRDAANAPTATRKSRASR